MAALICLTALTACGALTENHSATERPKDVAVEITASPLVGATAASPTARPTTVATATSAPVTTAIVAPTPPTLPPPPAPGRETRADGAELLYRPTGSSSAQNPAFAPDGTQLLFTLFRGGYNKGDAALLLISLVQGSDLETAFDEPGHAAVNLPGSGWSAANGLISFASDRTGPEEIWVLKPGAPPTRVTVHDGPALYGEPSFSPDGDWIVFEEKVELANKPGAGREELGSIWKIRTDGSALTRLLDGPGTDRDAREPNWSPRNDRIVFQLRERGSDLWALFTISSDGTSLRRLTEVPGEHTDASWSPDGRWVVFSSTYGDLALPQIFAIPAEGGRPIRITRDDSSYDGAPSWSPDGKWIAFESTRGSGGLSSLWRIPAPDPN